MPRVTDVYAALPSITGKFELEYEGELRGAEQVARDLIRSAVGSVFTGMFDGVDTRTVVEWFDLGGSLPLSDDHVRRRRHRATRGRPGTARARRARRRWLADAPAPVVASAIDFVLEGLCAQKKDQPERRARLRGERRGSRGARRAARSRCSTRRSACRAGEEEVLQLDGH